MSTCRARCWWRVGVLGLVVEGAATAGVAHIASASGAARRRSRRRTSRAAGAERARKQSDPTSGTRGVDTARIVSISAPVLMAGLTGDIPAWNPLAHTPLAGRLDV